MAVRSDAKVRLHTPKPRFRTSFSIVLACVLGRQVPVFLCDLEAEILQCGDTLAMLNRYACGDIFRVLSALPFMPLRGVAGRTLLTT